MKAVKCDRCGNYFDKEIGVIQYFDKASDDHYQHLDICGLCLERFKRFMTPEECVNVEDE